jgi:uncharacterized protein
MKKPNRKDFSKGTFAGLRSLADLPYFELADNGLLRLTVDELDKGIDGHTHLALNALDGPKPNLLAKPGPTQYYIGPDTPLSMNNYMGQNQTESDIAEMTKSLLGTISPGGSAATETHTIPNLIEEIDLLRIEKTVILPIAYGFPYGDDITEWYLEAIEKSGKKERFIICGSVKPTLPEAVEKTKALKLKGVKGIKLHPNMARFTPNDKRAWAFYEECTQLRLPVLIHCGLVGKEGIVNPDQTMGYTGRHAEIAHFFEPIEEFPNLQFVLCHSGGIQNDQAIGLARKNRNVWLDIQGQSVVNIRKMIAEVGPERLMFGSDWPFFPVASLLVRLLIATEGDKKIRKLIFSENARRFWGLV